MRLIRLGQGDRFFIYAKSNKPLPFIIQILIFLAKFPELERYEVIKTIKTTTDTPDNQLKNNNIAEIDFIKIVTQGHELPILQGSINYLKNIIGLEIKVEFAPLYKHQPFFNEVDNFIRKYNFELLT